MLRRLFGRRYQRPKGILLYPTVQELILLNQQLTRRGFQVRLVAPPPEVRIGCDLAIEFDPIEQEAIETALRELESHPQRVVSTREMLPDVLRQSTFVEIGRYLMCRTGNMKLTVNLDDHRIVNISGGGCPDIPYVAHRLCGERIESAPDPVDLGSSLCTYLLQLAFDALKGRIVR
jgi:hypothetical protein